MDNIDKFLKKYNIQFKNKHLLKMALTHKSYTYENNVDYDYERLEFLGDALLSKVTAEMIYKKYPHEKEGSMSLLRSSLLNGKTLAKVAKDMGLDKIIMTGKSKDNKNNNKIIEDVFEAFVGALYLDKGEKDVVNFLKKNLFKNISININDNKNPKTLLQEYLQVESREITQYKTVKKKTKFISDVYHDSNHFGTGSGTNKKEAEIAAAVDALKRMGKK